jgi:hypothetical protein
MRGLTGWRRRFDTFEARLDRLTITVEKLAENVADSSMVGVLQHVTNADADPRTTRELDELRARVEAPPMTSRS